MNKNLKAALIIGGVVLLTLIVFPLLGGGWGMMGAGMMGGFGGGWWMGILMVLVPILIIWSIVALTRGDAWSSDHTQSRHGESALEVLRRRYARGDIAKQEFEEKRRDLE